jgi:hypothetical protein
VFSLYNQLKEKIEKVNFSELWTGFHPFKFALYDDKKVYLDGTEFEKDDRFIANTAIEFNNEYIAIWNIDLTIDIDVLASKIIHEMFHAFQITQHEKRWPNEITEGLGYRYIIENLSIKEQENRILLNLLDNFKYTEFEYFLLLRKYRQYHYKNEFEYESKVEVIEGMAEYIELKALKQLNYDNYSKSLESIKNEIGKFANLIPIRTMCYHIGALLLIICDQNQISFDHEIGYTNKTTFEIVSKDLVYRDIKFLNSKNIEVLVNNYYNELHNKINTFINSAQQTLSGNFKISGLDPQNSRMYQNQIYCKSFLAYRNVDDEATFISKECVAIIDDNFIINEIYF